MRKADWGLAVMLIVVMLAGVYSFVLTSQLTKELKKARLETSRLASATSINVEYDIILQSLLAKLKEYDTLNQFSEREITDLARLIMEQSALQRESGLTPALILALIEVESGFNPDAISSAGAIGLAQVMPGTARIYLPELGYLEYSQELLTDPLLNVRIGIKHLMFLHRMLGAEGLEDFDDFDLSLVAYNWGEGPLRRLIGGLDDPADMRYAVKVRDHISQYIERGLN